MLDLDMRGSAFPLRRISTLWTLKRILHRWRLLFKMGTSTLLDAKESFRLQWINEGGEGSKFSFDYLKRKVAANKVIGLHRGMDILQRIQQRS